MPKIDLPKVPDAGPSGYPPIYRAAVEGRRRQRIGDAGGLTQFGVNLMRLAPGAASSQRHWHAAEDEFVYVLAGDVVLVEDDGEAHLRAGEAAAFPAGAACGHHLVNRSNAEALILEVGSRAANETVEYTDANVDMRAVKNGGAWRMLHKDGKPW